MYVFLNFSSITLSIKRFLLFFIVVVNSVKGKDVNSSAK